MEACYGGTDMMERSCAVARGIDINRFRICLCPNRDCKRRESAYVQTGTAEGVKEVAVAGYQRH
jgi:hypothetical protein